jgi:hypothetical protein
MAKSPEQLDRAAEFWDRHLAQPYIIDDKSLSLLSGTINALKDKGTSSLEHIQALVLAVSLCESQIRDCIRLAIDSSFMEIDPDNPLIKEIKFDFRLFNSVPTLAPSECGVRIRARANQETRRIAPCPSALQRNAGEPYQR